MKTFKDYTGTEGIDKVLECASDVNEIITDSDIMKAIDSMSWLEMGATVVKKHGEAFDRIRAALGNEENTNSMGLAYSAAQLMKDILTDKDTLDFFMSFAKTKN